MEYSQNVGLWQRIFSRVYHARGVMHRYWGNRLVNRGQYAQAVADFSRAVALDPDFVQALYDRAILYWREFSQAERADRDFTQVITLDPERSDAWFNRALARQNLSDVAGATADFQHYLRIGKDPMWLEISRRQLALLREAVTGKKEGG